MSLQAEITDTQTGATYKGEIPEIPKNEESAKPKVSELPEIIRVSSYFPKNIYWDLMRGKADATLYIQQAIEESWAWVLDQYNEWTPEEDGRYPVFQGSKRAWGASSAAAGIPVILPPATLRVDIPIELPQCVPLLGSGYGSLLGGSKLRFLNNACLSVIGNIELDQNLGDPFQMISGGIAGIKFVRGNRSPVELLGNLSNFRISSCHFSGVGQRLNPMIFHRNAYEEETSYGKILTGKNSGHTLKEVTIENCQFEGGLAAMDLTGALNLNIHNNTILYAHIGMMVRNSKKVRITNNNVLGTKDGEPIQVEGQAGIVLGGSDATAQGNQFNDLDLGCAVSGRDHHFFLNDWTRVRECNNGSSAIVDQSWRFPRDFGRIKEGSAAPFAG